jgi:hypothetical protein
MFFWLHNLWHIDTNTYLATMAHCPEQLHLQFEPYVNPVYKLHTTCHPSPVGFHREPWPSMSASLALALPQFQLHHPSGKGNRSYVIVGANMDLALRIVSQLQQVQSHHSFSVEDHRNTGPLHTGLVCCIKAAVETY